MYKTELNEIKKDQENELDDNKESFVDHKVGQIEILIIRSS